MTAALINKNSTERREKRAQSIAAMGLVNREGDRFRVSTPSLRGKQTSYEVWRDTNGKIRCNCLEYEENAVNDSSFRCEHILAVKYSLLAKNSENIAKQPEAEKEKPVEVVSKTINATEERADFERAVEEKESRSEIRNPKSEIEVSARSEQKTGKAKAAVSENGQSEALEAKPSRLANKKGENTMKPKMVKDEPAPVQETVQTEETSNVLSGNFPTTLRALRQNVNPNLVKSREGWRDRNGNVHMVDYVEWHTVADILDENAPNWTHAIRDIRQIGDVITVIVAITIDGVTREGIGTGSGESELGIKKAEHDALKRAAVKFGIARELYRKESDVIEREGAVPPQTDGGFPANPVAKSLADLVTAKQLGMIRAVARENGIDPDEECNAVMNCKTDELSKKAASTFIQHLQNIQQEAPAQAPLRRVS